MSRRHAPHVAMGHLGDLPISPARRECEAHAVRLIAERANPPAPDVLAARNAQDRKHREHRERAAAMAAATWRRRVELVG